MCTALAYLTKDFYFGRTLDNEFSYGEEIAVMPRNFYLRFRCAGSLQRHYAMIGTAHLEDGCPLYYDAVNEKGLGMAGLNFVGNAVYHAPVRQKDNVASFEFIPWILGQCASVKEAKALVERINLTDAAFSQNLPVAQLHWIISDREGSIVVESVEEGIRVYENPVGILTNNPPFGEQMFQLNNYMHLSPKSPTNQFSDRLSLHEYSLGMGALGLPGDLSSQSRFIRASFVKMNSVCGQGEKAGVNQFFHILGSVEQPRGCCEICEGKYETTLYTSCCNADLGMYYYTTYGNHQITAVDMYNEDLDAERLASYPLILKEQIAVQNAVS